MKRFLLILTFPMLAVSQVKSQRKPGLYPVLLTAFGGNGQLMKGSRLFLGIITRLIWYHTVNMKSILFRTIRLA